VSKKWTDLATGVKQMSFSIDVPNDTYFRLRERNLGPEREQADRRRRQPAGGHPLITAHCG